MGQAAGELPCRSSHFVFLQHPFDGRDHVAPAGNGNPIPHGELEQVDVLLVVERDVGDRGSGYVTGSTLATGVMRPVRPT